MQDAPKSVWSIPYVSVALFPSLQQNFIAFRSSKMSDCIFEIHQLWQSGFSRVYSNSCCSCSFEPEIIRIVQSSHKMSSNNIVNFQESTTILNACKRCLENYWRHHVSGDSYLSCNLYIFLNTHPAFLWLESVKPNCYHHGNLFLVFLEVSFFIWSLL